MIASRFFPSLLLVPILQLSHNYTDQSSCSLLFKLLMQTAIIEAIKFSSRTSVFLQVVELDLGGIVPSLSGPKRPHDRVPVSIMKQDFQHCLINQVRFNLAKFESEAQRLSTVSTF